jgi:two-component system cell cycle response regulator CtrA
VDVDARIDGLQAEVDRLQGRVEQLEAAMGMRVLTPMEWRLTPMQMRVFGVLLARELATKAAIMAALYRDDGRDEADPKIVDVFVCHVRRKLKAFDVPIETIWGQGYRMSPAAKDRARDLMAGAA